MSSPAPPPATSPPPASSASPPPPSSTPPPATSPPSPPPTAVVTPPSPPSAPPPATSPPSPPSSSTPPPTTSPPSLPLPSAPPPTTSPPSPPSSSSPPPTTSPPSPPAPISPSPPTGGGGVNKTPPPPPNRTGSPPANRGYTPPYPPYQNGDPPPLPPSPSGGGVSTALVVGIAIGGTAILILLTLVFICCKKKKKRRPPPTDYYAPPPPPHALKPDPYTGAAPAVHNWHQPPPPLSPGGARRPPHPPPPPAYHSSSGGSNYSPSETARPPPKSSPSMGLGFSKNLFTYEDLSMATDGFSNANLLGQGGFGYVHRGILPDKKEIAVKQLKVGSGQGEREFQAEVEIISRVHHKHLVSLVGYCISGTERLLVYEFVPNNTLEFHLHGKGRPVMEWTTRLRISLGSAKGLAYLHEDCHPKIIHRDIKASNILLDFNFEAKVADFGLAKFYSDANTHVSTRVMGTFGYLAPEYASSGKLTEKSDVFSFGVMLLELITGRRPVDPTQAYADDSLVDWARPLLSQALEDGNFDSLVDPNLRNEYNHSEMARMVACAAACVRHSAKRRPRMSQVVRALEGVVSLSDLNEGIKPGQSSVYSSHGSSDYDTAQYNENIRKFRKMALASREYESSGLYSEPTSEYGLNPSGSSSEGRRTREMEMGKRESSGGFKQSYSGKLLA